MINPIAFKDKRVVVLGLGKSGRTTSIALERAGAIVLSWDDNDAARDAAIRDGIALTDPKSYDWSRIDFLVISPGIPHTYPAPHPVAASAKEHGIPIISDVEILYLTCPDAKYIGITGTNGKSTTTALVGHILKTAGINVQVGGNIGIPVMELDALGSDGYYVLEMSSYQLEIAPSIHFDASVILNITPDHLDRHGGMDGYRDAKQLIFKNSQEKDTLIIGIDDPVTSEIFKEVSSRSSFTVKPMHIGSRLNEGISVHEGILYSDGAKIADVSGCMGLRGAHNWQNLAAAYGLAKAVGIADEVIMRALMSFPGLEHRQQHVATIDGIEFINDSKATNAEAVEKALLCFQGRTIYWILGGRAKEGGIEALRPYFDQVKHAFLYGECRDSFALTMDGAIAFDVFENLEQATNAAYDLAVSKGEGDCVILLSPACASFDQFRDFEVRGRAFCDYVLGIRTNHKAAV